MISLRSFMPVAVGILLAFNGCGSGSSSDSDDGSADARSSSDSRLANLTIPDGTPLRVTLSDMIQTNQNHIGDQFSGVVAESVMVNGETVIPARAGVRMVITRLVKGGTLKTSPEIAFTIQEVTLVDGNSYRVDASEISQKGRSHTKREVGMIGGGAAAGAVVGGLIGKGKGAVIGTAVGAAAGTGAAAATGRQNLIFAPGRTVTFTLRQPLNVVAAR